MNSTTTLRLWGKQLQVGEAKLRQGKGHNTIQVEWLMREGDRYDGQVGFEITVDCSQLPVVAEAFETTAAAIREALAADELAETKEGGTT